MRISDWSSDVCSSDLLRPPQVHHILTDCNVRVLVTSRERLLSLGSLVERCPDLRYVVLIDAQEDDAWPATSSAAPTVLSWSALQRAAAPGSRRHPRTIDSDMAAILYTSGSTGLPKGVVLSHRNLVVGSQSVSQYLENGPKDSILSALPHSFDAGPSPVTTAFCTGARLVLLI